MVRLRDRVGLNIAPLFLRITIGAVFIWAGLGKVSQFVEVSGESAAALAQMGVIPGPTPPPAKPAEPAPAAEQPTTPPAEPVEKPGVQAPAPGPAIVTVGFQQPAYTAADFPNPTRVRMLHMLSLSLRTAANPGVDAEGKPLMRLWPQRLGAGSAPVYFAWAVALTELCGGVGILIGLMTRIWSVAVAGVMLGAIWLTECGPAIQSGKTALGFLPVRPTFDPGWMSLTLQLTLLGAALALAFAGPGRLSLDHALLSGRTADDDD